MTRSRSTTRVRHTQLLYLGMLGIVACSDGRTFEGTTGLVMQVLGLALVTVASLGRIWVSTFIAGRKDAELVTRGPYARVRNPLYLLSLAAALGLALGSRSLVLLIALPAMLGVLLMRAVRAEEAFLARTHGLAYAEYLTRVRRFWPSESLPTSDAVIRVDLAVYWKAFLDAGAMLLLYALLLLLDGLRTSGSLPVLFALP